MSDGITDFNRMVEKCKDYDRIKAEFESDDWMKHATEFYQNGGCPICFSNDEAGCTEGCYLGQLKASHDRLVEALEAADLSLEECAKHLLGRGPLPEPEAIAITMIQINQALAEAEKL
ncbi:MAG: hypothetical protein MUO31_13260 [Thermodesulfovibrionales bacterium]|nr:hypothetical protein [Thermodesulfovibrionales bacterium]